MNSDPSACPVSTLLTKLSSPKLPSLILHRLSPAGAAVLVSASGKEGPPWHYKYSPNKHCSELLKRGLTSGRSSTELRLASLQFPVSPVWSVPHHPWPRGSMVPLAASFSLPNFSCPGKSHLFPAFLPQMMVAWCQWEKDATVLCHRLGTGS